MSTTDKWTLIIAASAVLFSIFSYWLTQRRELAWKRTEFLFGQSSYLDNDPALIEVLDILERRHLEIKLNDVFDPESNLDAATRLKYLQYFDKLLNFLWRLCYAYLTVKTIKKKEIKDFSWWLRRISEYPPLVDYCKKNGYEEILITIEEMRPDWKGLAQYFA